MEKSLSKIECTSRVNRCEWDELTERLGGYFSHCYAYCVLQAVNAKGEPLFVKAFDRKGECIGIAVGSIVSPRFWPFSRFCKNAVFGALPLTADKSAATERAVMAALEKELKRRGVFQMNVCSYDSPNSATVLSSLSYQLYSRVEFYLDLSRPLEDIWKTLKGARRTDIRKAETLGVQTLPDSTMAGLRLLETFQAASMQRRGVEFRPTEAAVESARAMLLDTDRATLLVSARDGTPLNAAMFGLFGGKAYYLHSGSSVTGNKSCGPVHLLWTMIEILKKNDCKCLNLGGASVSGDGKDCADGLYKFKEDFGATVVPQPAGSKIISRLGAGLNTILSFSKQVLDRTAGDHWLKGEG